MFSPGGLVRSTHVDTYTHFAWRLGFGYNSRIYPWCWSCCFLSRWHHVRRPSSFAYAHGTEHASAGLLVVLFCLCAVWRVCHLTCLDLGRGQLIEMSLNWDVMSSGFGSFEWSSAPWTSVMSLSFCEVIQLRIGFSRPGTTHTVREHEQYSLRSSAWNCSVALKEYWFPYAEIVVLDFSSGGFGHSLL